MSGTNTEIAVIETPAAEDDLDSFNDLLYNNKKTVEEEVKVDDAKPVIEEDTDLANTEDEDDEPELPLEEEEPKPKKNRTQERIEQLLQKEREANERANALEARLKQLEEKEPAKAAPAPKQEEDHKAPHWEDKNEDGTEKYPLGQFDPSFAADYIKYNVEKELTSAREADAKAKAEAETQARVQAQRDELTNNWNAKLEPAKERYPDFLEKGDNLVDTFAGIDQAYGEYLTSTLMSMEYGPDVLYYLSNNIDEAQRIVNLGPAGATVALGRLEAQFITDDSTKPRPKVSKAPAPPPTNKGSVAAAAEVPDDTDDLDAFTAKMYGKKR